MWQSTITQMCIDRLSSERSRDNIRYHIFGGGFAAGCGSGCAVDGLAARAARAARVAPGKGFGYVFGPIGENEEAGPYNAAVEVMRAHIANDEELREALNLVARESARQGGRPLPIEEWPSALRDLVEDTSLLDQLALEEVVVTVARELTDTRACADTDRTQCLIWGEHECDVRNHVT